ncbi:MAG: tRNA pseudouridine(55) synthase TruB [Mogibacterium sp.]|nr:tRNA pseudouridine(55) synthase TruB [Mogibacterium sp.]
MKIDGVINVNKPAGWTSQDVCAKLRNRLHIKKLGHTGTLDPMATGVLPVCTGKATRIIEYYGHDRKSYHASMKLGLVTDTLDITGEVLETAAYADVCEKAVREAFKAYTGHVLQVPPKYSALKVDGKRAYELAREGKDFELKAREIEIFSNDISRLDLGSGEIEFDVTCSKGTYIRTICDDIGRTLGCGAVMTALVRTGSGFFTIENSAGIDEISEDPERYIMPMDETLAELGRIILNDNRIIAFTNGNPTREGGYAVTEPSGYDELYRVYGNGSFLGVAAVDSGDLIPQKVLI